MEVSSPDKRAAKSRLDIEIHEDAIIVAQSRPSALELEDALQDLSLNDRRPLGEIDLKLFQDGASEAAQIHFSSPTSSFQSSDRIHSPSTTYKIRAYKKDIDVNEERQEVDSTLQRTITNIYESSNDEDHQRVALTPEHRYTKSIVEISKRQQGQGEHRYNEGASSYRTPATPLTKALRSLAAMSIPASRRTVSNKENWTPSREPNTPIHDYDALEAAVVEAATPPTTHSRPQSSGQAVATNYVATVDAAGLGIQDETVGTTDTATETEPAPLTPLREDSPASVVYNPTEARKTPSPELVAAKPTIAALKSTPIVRTTKAAQARIQLAHGPKTTKTAAWGPPRLSLSGHARTGSLAVTPRAPSGGSSSSDDEKKEVSIPHSKPRPMSMIFPAPPPPPKGRAPTKSTFVLPGEIVAAKLKAAREEREQKDDGAKTFKARPVPAYIKNAPAVRQTNTSRARESIGGRESVLRMQSDTAHRRASSAAGIRMENKPPRASRPSSRDKPLDVVAIKEVDLNERPATSLANISKPRSASPAPVMIARPMSKGREVFTRDVFANAAAEREKRAKEDALRRARADAAERSRQLSREWAEKKRREAMEAKQVKV